MAEWRATLACMTESPLTALEIVRTRSLASLVAQEIERMILAGELAAGERLHEQSLATRLGTSRGPVREAIRGLERLGLVVTVVNQGSYVRQVGEAEALELYEVRAVLTGQACATLAETIASVEMAELRGLAECMAAQQAVDAAGYFLLNRQFHEALLRFAGNARAGRICEELGNELNLWRRRSLVTGESMQESNAEHAAILVAIAAGSPARARAAGEKHIRGGKRRFAATRPGVAVLAQGKAPQSRPKTVQASHIGRTTDGNFEADGPARRGRGAGVARDGGTGPG